MTKIKRRGRPSKDENSSDSSVCIIRDPLMEPFYVKKDSNGYTLIEKVVSTRGFAGREATGKTVEKTVGYYTKFQNVLRVVAKGKFYKTRGEFETITEYIDAWDEVKTGMELLLKKVEI